MKKYCLLSFLLFVFQLSETISAFSFLTKGLALEHKVEYFNLQDVRLLDGPFRRAQDIDKQYILSMDADRLLSPFLRESGLTPKASGYTNWENTGLDGHIGGHYLSALSHMYASTADQQIKDRLDYMIAQLRQCQDANGNGYIGGVPGGRAIWEEIYNGDIRAGAFDLNGKWVPLYNIHKTYAGLRDAYLLTGNGDAKEMLIKMSDWAIKLVSNLSDSQIQDMLRSEYGGLNETFADVAAITGNEKYLKLAHQFSQQAILEPLLQHEDKLTGMHANTQIPKVLGFMRIADIEGNKDWADASHFFWETVVYNRSVCIGGNSVSEHFHPANDFSRMIKSIEGPETCNTYNMLRLTKMLYQFEPKVSYIDYYERALYNHILSTQHPDKGGFVYFTQMRPGHYRVYSQPQTSMWCCVGSGLENHAKYGEMIYAHSKDTLYVNLFIASKLNWRDLKTEVIQENNFPDKPRTLLTINSESETKFTIKIRHPEWVERGKLKIRINNTQYPVVDNGADYISINREWKKGDKIEVDMPMQITTEQMPDKSNYFAIKYGPIILAAKTKEQNLDGLFADDSRGGHIAHGRQIPLKDMPIIVADPEQIPSLVEPVVGKPLTFTLTGLYPDQYSEGMELIPFFRLHDSRYIVYWAQSDKGGLAEIRKQIEDEEKERIMLDAITLDKVICGEQQPESDHFITNSDSWTGAIEDVHWREARGWFSYQLKNNSKNAQYIYLKYFDKDINRVSQIFINNNELTTIKTDGRGEDKLITVTYPIPENEINKDIITIKVGSLPDIWTTKFAEIRLLSEDIMVNQ